MSPAAAAPEAVPTPVSTLEGGLSARRGRPVRVAELASEPLTASSHAIDRWRVTLDTGERLGVIFKRLQPGEKLYGNEREVRVYRRLLDGRRFGAPALYASADDASRGRYWLFLEDVGGRTLKHSGPEEWRAAVRWLAGLHAAYWGREEQLCALGCLGEHGPEFYHQVAAAARRNLELAGARAALARFDGLMGRFAEVVAFLARRPRTLIHGDIFPRNLIIQPGPVIRPVDWESAAAGLAAWDLTRLLDGWGRDRPGFVALYLEELERRTGTGIDRPAFQRTLLRCEVLNVLWHLRWSAEACADEGFVAGELRELEAVGERLRKEGSHA